MNSEKTRNNPNTGNNAEEIITDMYSSKSAASDTEDMTDGNNANISRYPVLSESNDVNDDDDDD